MQEEIKFDDFCKGFGFKSYPFNFFTAEDEKARQGELFVTTKLYSPLLEAFEAGSTMLLSGDRGTGKTSITYDFIRRSDNLHLLCQIDDFSSLPQYYSEADFYKFITWHMVNAFFGGIGELRSAGGKLTEDEKILLTYFYVNFAADATRGLVKRAARDIQIPKWKRILQSFYNSVRNPLNIAANVGVAIAADVVARASGASAEVKAQVSEYFPEVSAGVEAELPKADDTLEALRRFSGLVKKCGYKRIVVVLDKVDEDPRLDNDAEEISEFILPILSNNKFLLDDGFQVVASLWVVPLNFIKDKVRTQKVYSPEIVWEFPDLKAALDQRVKVFSEGPARNFSNIFRDSVSESVRGSILDLSNRNPRDLWHLMNKIFRAQYRIDAKVKEISEAAVHEGMREFVSKFNFYEYYPRKANARKNSMDVYSYIKHLLKLDAVRFTRNQLNDKAGTGSSTQNYTVGMENLGLIEREVADKGEAVYRIRDPKIKYAIENSIDISKG
ncbi:P-loop ATPase, Sll1717 family [Paracoccus sp. FO-3]|uniref:P-loop ATPase, Sll1717 family n=1 Tax=Paracoccus sp. FO-3 TaxID=1335059 RepID=UPI00112C55DE|nr:hypothetical protein [Paracoccus sp. FO-3]